MTREELIRRIESCLENAAVEKDHGSPVYDPYDQWQACVDVLQDALRALAPAPHAADVALVDDFLSAHRSVWANTGDEAERHVYRQEADASRAALLARFDAIRREAIEECARVADPFPSDGFPKMKSDMLIRNEREVITRAIRALKGK